MRWTANAWRRLRAGPKHLVDLAKFSRFSGFEQGNFDGVTYLDRYF